MKFKTLQVKLFISYSSFFIITLFAIAILFYSFFSNYTTEKVSQQQGQLCMSISNSLDEEVKKMDTISMNILYSNLIKDHFQTYLSLRTSTPESNISIYSERYSNIRSLIDVIMAILGPFQTVSQANIYDFNGNMIGAGLFNGEVSVDLNKMPWHNKTLNLNGSKYISVPSHIKLLDSANFKQYENHQFISTTRTYSDSNYSKQGIVEIVQDCETVFKYINDIKKTDNNLQIYVFNQEGSYIYPYDNKNVSTGAYYQNIIKNQKLSALNIHNVKSPTDGSKQAMTYTISDYSGWSIIVVQSQKIIFSSLIKFTSTFIFLSILILFMILLLSYVVSRKVTVPLRKLGHALKNMNIDELASPISNEPHMDNNTLNEIEHLNKTFNTMYQKLGRSLNELLIAKSEEMNAKLLAMQSQMNPHFLYNNLANISVMAEEGMNKEIVSMCHDVSFMLRYISTDSKNGVDLRSEIDYTEKYLNCMKIRYEENLKFEIIMEAGMLDIIVPKLLIQPLVENSMKHGLNSPAPWNISVHGYLASENWYLEVTDTGLGFDPVLIDKFKELMASPNDPSDLPDLHIGGMGLINICTRLKLMYKEKAIFTIANLPSGGAAILISGLIRKVGPS